MKLLPGFSRRFRRSFLLLSLVLWTATAYIVFGPEAKQNVMPGPLSDPHAFMVADCGNCHVDGTGLVKGLSTGFEHSEISLLEGHRCLACHERGTFAFQAHSADPAVLAAIRADRSLGQIDERGLVENLQSRLGFPISDRGELACAVCHREHRGRETKLKDLSDAICQTCHVDGNDHFPDSHPAFDAWPYQSRNRIIFDHAGHQSRHFPQEEKAFDCAQCHGSTDASGFMETLSFENACTTCHNHSEQILGTGKTEAGFKLLTAFGLDLESLEEAGEGVKNWPADGVDFEEKPTELSLLLIAADPDYSEAEKDIKLSREFDLSDMMDASEEQLVAAARMARAFQRLVEQLATDPEATLSARMKVVTKEHSLGSSSAFAAAWSQVALQDLNKSWMKATNKESSFSDGEGRWYLDKTQQALRFVPHEHADPILTFLHRLAYRSGNDSLIAELEQDGRCTKCHSVDRVDEALEINFRAKEPKLREDLTHFDHRPHLKSVKAVQESSDEVSCVYCHVIDASEDYLRAFSSPDSSVFRAGFAAVNQASCATCHHEEKTGSSCVDCHNYHMR